MSLFLTGWIATSLVSCGRSATAMYENLPALTCVGRGGYQDVIDTIAEIEAFATTQQIRHRRFEAPNGTGKPSVWIVVFTDEAMIYVGTGLTDSGQANLYRHLEPLDSDDESLMGLAHDYLGPGFECAIRNYEVAPE